MLLIVSANICCDLETSVDSICWDALFESALIIQDTRFNEEADEPSHLSFTKKNIVAFPSVLMKK